MQDDDESVKAGRGALCLVFEAEALGVSLLAALVYFKLSYLKTLGPAVVTRFLDGGQWSFAGLAPLFARDVWLCLALLPAGYVALAWLSRRAVRIGAALGLGLAVPLCALADLGQEITGALPSGVLLAQAARAWLSDPDIMAPDSAVQPVKWLRLGALAALLALGWLAPRLGRRISAPLRVAALAAPLAALAYAAPQLSGPEQRLRLARPYARLVVEALARPARRATEVVDLPPGRRPLDAFRDAFFPNGAPPDLAPAAHAPPLRRPANVVWVILETASYRDYPIDRLPSEMPNVTRLVAHAAIGTRHLASSRLSIREDFALHAGLLDCCDGEWMAAELRARRARPPDSLARILRERGYATYFFYPAPFTYDVEAWLVEYLGFEHVALTGAVNARGAGPRRVEGERGMFARAEEALRHECARGRPAFVVARSLIGHYPLLDLETQQPATGGRTEALRSIAGEIDKGIGRLAGALEACGALDDTIFVVVGDHGPRTTSEDPSLDLRFLDEQTFQVPLAISYARAFPRPMRIGEVTSHVDVVPTVLDLLGIPRAGYLHQGLSVFDPALRERALPYAAGEFSPQRGIAYAGAAFSFDRENDVAALGPWFEPARRRVLAGSDPRRAAFVRLVDRFDVLRGVTLGALTRPAPAEPPRALSQVRP